VNFADHNSNNSKKLIFIIAIMLFIAFAMKTAHNAFLAVMNLIAGYVNKD
jgi:hypothetical protein